MGTAPPVFETRLADHRSIARHKRTLIYLCAEVPAVRVGDHLARIVARFEVQSDELIESKLFGAGYLNRSVERRTSGDLGERGSDIVGRNRLNERCRRSNAVAVGCVVG